MKKLSKEEIRNKLLSMHKRFFVEEYHFGQEKWKIKYIYDLLDMARVVGIDIRSANILDVGCGSGDVLLFLNSLGYQYLSGVDARYNSSIFKGKDTFMKSFQRSGQNWPNRIFSFYRVDIDTQKLPFSDTIFDVIYMFDVIEHLRNPVHILRECKRVLQKKGLLFITTPSAVNFQKRITTLLGKNPFGSFQDWLNTPYPHLREYTKEELRHLLLATDFQVLAIKYYRQCSFPPLMRHLPKLLGTSLLRMYNLLEYIYPRFSARIGIFATSRFHDE